MYVQIKFRQQKTQNSLIIKFMFYVLKLKSETHCGINNTKTVIYSLLYCILDFEWIDDVLIYNDVYFL